MNVVLSVNNTFKMEGTCRVEAAEQVMAAALSTYRYEDA